MSDKIQPPVPPEQREKFEEDIQKILGNFGFPAELRRKIFSDLMKYATEKGQKPKEKSNPNDDD